MGRVSRRVRVWGVRACACVCACVCVCLCLFVGEPGLFGRDLLHDRFVCDGGTPVCVCVCACVCVCVRVCVCVCVCLYVCMCCFCLGGPVWMGRVSRRVRVWGVRVCTCVCVCVCVCLFFVGKPGLFEAPAHLVDEPRNASFD